MSVLRSILEKVTKDIASSILSVSQRFFTTLVASGSMHYTIPTVTLTGAFKITLGVYPTVDQQHFLADSSVSGQDRVFMVTGSQGLRVNAGGATIQFTATIPLNMFSVVVLERDDLDVWKASVNGVDAAVFSGQGSSGNLIIDSIASPKGAATGIPFFSGIIANVNINNERFYKINENLANGSTIIDSSGNGQNGTAVNISESDLFTLQSNGDYLGVDSVIDGAPTTVNAPWVDNGNGSFSIDGSQVAGTSIVWNNVLEDNGTYLAENIVTSSTAGGVRAENGDINLSFSSGNGTHTDSFTTITNNNINIQANSTFNGTTIPSIKRFLEKA